MKKLKNNKKSLIIMTIIVILFAIGATITTIVKKDLSKNKSNNEIKENINSKDNKNELDKTTNEEENKDNDTNINKNESKDKINIKESQNVQNKTNKKQNKPAKDNTTTNKNQNTQDKTNSSNQVNQNNTTDKKTPNNNVNNSDQNNNSSGSNSNNANSTSKPEVENKPEVKPSQPIEEDKNNTKRKNIENSYGIKILYGDEIGSYRPKGVTPVKLTDSNDIENYLNRLNTELAKYPRGFFNDFNKKGMPLTIYLIKSANGSFAGFTDYQFMNDIKLTLATNYEFEYTVHHELMHYIDCYLDIVMYPSNPYSEYEALNPSGFVYGNATSSQIYNMGSNQRGAYFISSYGATHVKEDRAEVFKYMTARAYKPIGCFEPNEIIRKKAEIISKQIKTYFPSVSGTAHWDRFIN